MRLLFPSGTIAALYSGFGLSAAAMGASLSRPGPLLVNPKEYKDSNTENKKVRVWVRVQH
jgi:hypothetical protein